MGTTGGELKDIQNEFVRESCNVCSDTFAESQAYDGSLWCLHARHDSNYQQAEAGFYYAIDVVASAGKTAQVQGLLQMCPAGTYSSGIGYRVRCTPCPLSETNKTQTSYVGSTSAADCFTEKSYANPDQTFCQGQASDARQSRLTQLTIAECKQFAREFPEYGLTYSAMPACSDTETRCKDLVSDVGCGNAYPKVQGDSQEIMVSVDDVCKVSCKKCFNGVDMADPASLLMIPTGCVVDESTKIVRFYEPQVLPTIESPVTTGTYNGHQFRLACKAHICEENVTSSAAFFISRGDSTRDPTTLVFSEPTCKPTDNWWDNAASEEGSANKVFLPVTFFVTALAAFSAYMWLITVQSIPFGKLPRAAHIWVWFHIALRLFDMITDFGVYSISLKGKQFIHIYGESEAAAMQKACLAFAILGLLVTPLDMWASSKRIGGTKRSRSIAMLATIGIAILEDIPQLILTSTYMNAFVRFQNQDEAVDSELLTGIDTFSIMSLVASVGNIVYNGWLVGTAAANGITPCFTSFDSEVEKSLITRLQTKMTTKDVPSPSAGKSNNIHANPMYTFMDTDAAGAPTNFYPGRAFHEL